MIAPSQWPETFGFIILEALCRGIPVIASDLYGSIFLLKELSEKLVFVHDNVEELAQNIKYLLDKNNYEMICKKIQELELDINMDEHVAKVIELYK